MCHEMLKIKRVENSLDSKSLLVNFQNIFACCEMTLGIFLKCLTFTSKNTTVGLQERSELRDLNTKLPGKTFIRTKLVLTSI
mgnify:CR=1 FL=1